MGFTGTRMIVQLTEYQTTTNTNNNSGHKVNCFIPEIQQKYFYFFYLFYEFLLTVRRLYKK